MSALPPLATIPWKDLKEGKRLGQGAYGVVHVGVWQGRTVAIKKLVLDTLSERLTKEFQKEALSMWRCGESPHIVKLLGVCTEETHLSLVLEYMAKGSLYDVLSDEEELPWSPLRFRIARDIGKGLAYLHDREIIHRDLKSPNILLDSNHNAKISDFGLVKMRFATDSKLQSMNSAGRLVGTLQWLAPELFTLSPVYTKASDVYAYAMILWEIASRKIPYAEARVNIEEHVKKGERPPIPEVTPTPYQKLIEQAWHQQPDERPGIHYFVLQLDEVWSLPPAAPSIVPRFAPTIPQTPLSTPASPQITPSSAEPTVQVLQGLIIKLLDHPEMKHYHSLTPLLQTQLEMLLELSDSQSLGGSNLKIYKLAQKMIGLDSKISPSVAALLEKALAPQGNPLKPSSPAPVRAPVLPTTPLMAWSKAQEESYLEDVDLGFTLPTQIQIPGIDFDIIPFKPFGKTEWEKYFGDVGTEPPLPPNIEQILQSSCPFWPGKKIHETHILTLIPKIVNGKILTFNYLVNLLKKPKQGLGINCDGTPKQTDQYGHIPVESSYWVLMTKDVIEGSRFKDDETDAKVKIQQVKDRLEAINKSYQLPKAIEALASICTHFLRTEQNLYPSPTYSGNHTSFTCCEEVLENCGTWSGDTRHLPAAIGHFEIEPESYAQQRISLKIAMAKRKKVSTDIEYFRARLFVTNLWGGGCFGVGPAIRFIN